VQFADFWLADQLNSLAVLFTDLEYAICFYSFESDIWTGSTKGTLRVSVCLSFEVQGFLSAEHENVQVRSCSFFR